MKTRIRQVYEQTRWFLVPYAMLLLACIILRLIFTRNEIFFGLNEWHSGPADRFFRVWTYFGDWFTAVFAVLLLLFFSFKKALLAGVCSLTGSFVAQVLKRVVAFPRPRVFYANFFDEHGLSPKIYYIPKEIMLSNSSFPSGHAVTAFTLALLFAYFSRKKSLSIIVLGLAVFVAFSRMYLKQHFFEDVVAGSAIGVALTLMLLVFLGESRFLSGRTWNAGLIK